MSTDVREQIRQLAAAFDSAIDDVRIDEIVGPRSVGAPEVSAVAPELAESTPRRSTHWNRGFAAAAAVVLVLSLVAALTFSRGRSGLEDEADAPGNASVPPATWFVTTSSDPLGSFVWPSPPRAFASVDALAEAFTIEVLEWSGFTSDGGPVDDQSPQGFDLVNPATGASVQVIAVPSPDGWGFVQVGRGLVASLVDRAVLLQFPKSSAVATSTISVRLISGELRETSTDQDHVDVQGIDLEDLVSVLVVGRDVDGDVVSVNGGQFADTQGIAASVPGSVPGTTVVAPPTTIDPLVFAGTESWLPRWPSMSVSTPPASTSGYGMQLCDGGYGTKLMRVDSPTDTAHAYSGTLCVFIDLARSRADAVVSCSTSTPPYNYARCARRTDQTDVAGAGTATSEIANATQQQAMKSFPTGTSSSQAEAFDVELSASSFTFAEGGVVVQLQPPLPTDDTVDPPGVCYVIELDSGRASGCVGRSLLATGLAYGAFRDGDGPIEIVGIVPDEVTEIQIDGTTVEPVNNVWHVTIEPGSISPRIVVRSADGRETSTV